MKIMKNEKIMYEINNENNVMKIWINNEIMCNEMKMNKMK